MSHFPASGRTWPLGLLDIGPGLTDMDAKAQKTINGFTGSTATGQTIVTPSSTINVDGAGFAIESDIAWNTAKSYTRKFSPFVWTYDNTISHQWEPQYGSIAGLESHATFQKIWMPLGPQLIDGATITQMRAWFLVAGGRPAQVIVTPPTIFLSRRNELTGEVSAIGTAIFPAVFPTISNWAAYQNGGSPNVITMTVFNPSNVVIDLATYSYALLFQDDSGTTGPFNAITGFDITMGNVTTQRQP